MLKQFKSISVCGRNEIYIMYVKEQFSANLEQEFL